MFSALQSFETLAVSALLDHRLAMKKDPPLWKDKEQGSPLLTRGFIKPDLHFNMINAV